MPWTPTLDLPLYSTKPKRKVTVRMIVVNTTTNPELITHPNPTTVTFTLFTDVNPALGFNDIATMVVNGNEATFTLKPTAVVGEQQSCGVGYTYTTPNGVTWAHVSAGQIRIQAVAPPADLENVVRGIEMEAGAPFI